MIGTFTKNTLITFITRVLTAIFGILITIVIARVLGPEGQGIYSLAILLPTTLLLFTIFGLNVSSIFYIGRKKYSPQEVFGQNVLYSFFLGILTILIGLLIIFFFSDRFFPGVERVYLFLSIFLIPFAIFFDFVISVLLGMQKIKKYNLLYFFQSFLFLFLIVILILGLKFGITVTILAQIFSFAFIGIFLFFITKKEVNGLLLKFNKNYFKDALNYGFKNYLGEIFGFLHYRVDLFLVNFFINPIAVGFYYVAVKLAESIIFLSQSAATVLLPRVASEDDSKRLKEFTPLVCRNILFITFLIASFLFIFSHGIIKLFYSEEFLDSVRPFQILLIATIFIAGWKILGTDISARGNPMLKTYTSGLSVILNIILNILWIPKYGIVGAAWASLISYFVMFISMLFIYNKISRNNFWNVLFIQKSDMKFYKNFISSFKNLKLKNKI